MVLLKGREAFPFYFGASPEILARAGELRRNMTNSERILWECLRNKKLDGFRFRRQHPIDSFIVDFFCYEALLVVETDGSVHNDPIQAEYDVERTRVLNRFKIKVIRFTNQQVERDIKLVLSEIRRALKESLDKKEK